MFNGGDTKYLSGLKINNTLYSFMEKLESNRDANEYVMICTVYEHRSLSFVITEIDNKMSNLMRVVMWQGIQRLHLVTQTHNES